MWIKPKTKLKHFPFHLYSQFHYPSPEMLHTLPYSITLTHQIKSILEHKSVHFFLSSLLAATSQCSIQYLVQNKNGLPKFTDSVISDGIGISKNWISALFVPGKSTDDSLHPDINELLINGIILAVSSFNQRALPPKMYSATRFLSSLETFNIISSGIQKPSNPVDLIVRNAAICRILTLFQTLKPHLDESIVFCSPSTFDAKIAQLVKELDNKIPPPTNSESDDDESDDESFQQFLQDESEEFSAELQQFRSINHSLPSNVKDPFLNVISSDSCSLIRLLGHHLTYEAKTKVAKGHALQLLGHFIRALTPFHFKKFVVDDVASWCSVISEPFFWEYSNQYESEDDEIVSFEIQLQDHHTAASILASASILSAAADSGRLDTKILKLLSGKKFVASLFNVFERTPHFFVDVESINEEEETNQPYSYVHQMNIVGDMDDGDPTDISETDPRLFFEKQLLDSLFVSVLSWQHDKKTAITLLNAINARPDHRQFEQRLISTFNRYENPQWGNACSFMKKIFSHSEYSTFFFTNDVKLIVDITLRLLTSFQPMDMRRLSSIQLLGHILTTHALYAETDPEFDSFDNQYRLDEIRDLLNGFARESDQYEPKSCKHSKKLLSKHPFI